MICGMVIPQKFSMPVENGTKRDYNQKSFWFYPWGKSITHKGVDIFAKSGTNVLSSTMGLVIYEGNIKSGGNVVLVLGPKWRLHYYAHLKTIDTKMIFFCKKRREDRKCRRYWKCSRKASSSSLFNSDIDPVSMAER